MTLLLIYLGAFLFGICSFVAFKDKYTDSKGRISLARLDMLSLGLIYICCFVGMLMAAAEYPRLISYFSLGVFAILSSMAAYFSVRPFPGKIQLLMDYLLCVLGTMLIAPETLMLSASFYGLLLLTSLFWLFGWHLIRFFDQFPFVSFVMTSVWAMGLILVGQIVPQIPRFLLVAAGFAGIMGFVCFRKRFSLLITNMGLQSISLLGFFWAGVWAYFFFRGHYLPSTSLYSYYIMEFVVLIACALTHRPLMPLSVKALQTQKQRGKVLKSLFWNMLLITILALSVMFFKNSALLFLTLAVLLILFCQVSQFKNLDQQKPGYRDILVDMKKGAQEVYNQTKKVLAEKKVEKTKTTPHVSPKKKSIQKKPVKGKGKKKK